MTEAEHLEIANRLYRLAERLGQDGDDVAMAEMLWGAANRVTNAIAIQHQLGRGNRLPRLGSVVHHHLIYDHQIELNLRRGTEAVGALHGHFYNSHLAHQDLPGRVALTQTLFADLIDIYDRHGKS